MLLNNFGGYIIIFLSSIYFGVVYASRPHKHFKTDFTLKLSSQQHVKYGSNLSPIYQSTYKIWKQSNKDFSSYQENDEISADAA